MKKVRVNLITILGIGLLLSMSLYGSAQGAKDGVLNPEFRIKFGVLSHRDSLFGNCGFIVGVDCLLHFGDGPFGIAGELESITSHRITFYENTTWKDTALILSFLYFPTSMREIYFGMGLEYHWIIKEEQYLWSNYCSVQSESGLGLHLVGGFNFGKYIFLEGKISSVGIGYRNKGGISLQIGSRF